MQQLNVPDTRVDASNEQLGAEFAELTKQWRKQTALLSISRQKAMHPAYQKIIGMGQSALPFIFSEMKTSGGDWLWALESIVRNENPAQGITDFKEAVAVWLAWGRENGFVS